MVHSIATEATAAGEDGAGVSLEDDDEEGSTVGDAIDPQPASMVAAMASPKDCRRGRETMVARLVIGPREVLSGRRSLGRG